MGNLKEINKEPSGFLYLNVGTSYLARLTTSINSLRYHYKGNITISCDESSYNHCLKIKDLFNVDVKLEKNLFEDKTYLIPGKWQVLKCRSIEYTPYNTTFFLDSDTIILRDPSEVLNLADQHDFIGIQWSRITTTYYKQLVRYDKWLKQGISPERIQKIKDYGPTLTDGCFAFSKRSEWMRDWYSLAKKHIKFSLPTEAVLQIYIMDYKHFIVPSVYNSSPKGNRFDRINRHTRIIHWCGGKNRMFQGKPLYRSEIWYEEFDKIRKSIPEFIPYDPILKFCLSDWDKYKESHK
jgi:hypothetical protein